MLCDVVGMATPCDESSSANLSFMPPAKALILLALTGFIRAFSWDEFGSARRVGSSQRLRVARHLPEGGAFERVEKSLTKLGEINAQAMRTRQHREASESAFGSFGLEERASCH